MFEFSARFRALQREAGLTAELLGSGATILRRANHAQDGYYNQAFFNLSAGFERSAKLAIILDYCMDNAGQFPADADLRKYGHDLKRLFRETESIRTKRNSTEANRGLPDSDIHKGIIQTLSDFAKATRYYNLDYLAKGQVSGFTEPIATWYSRVATPILAKHYRRQKRGDDEADAQLAQRVMGEVSFVLSRTETGEQIESIFDMVAHGARTKIIQKWGQFYTLQIIRYLANLISDLSYPAEGCSDDIPHLVEFFAIFLNEDRYLIRRKTWSPYKL
jgi:hypothetical protein